MSHSEQQEAQDVVIDRSWWQETKYEKASTGCRGFFINQLPYSHDHKITVIDSSMCC
jgi:hypothetical protein